MNKLVGYFSNTDLRNGHDGLSVLARTRGIKVENLGQGEFVAFVNRSQTSVKMYTSNVIAYMRLNKGRLDPRVITHLPKYFNGTSFNYDGAVESMIKKQFPKWFGTKEENK